MTQLERIYIIELKPLDIRQQLPSFPSDTSLLLFFLLLFFQRLNTANEEIIEVLLSKQQVGHHYAQINKHFGKFGKMHY